MLWQPSLPERYLKASEDELALVIAARKAELGSKLLILGHHYQQNEVIRHADFIGDSLKLSQLAAAEAPKRGAKFIVFCGVHFMAETADILTSDDVDVILPDLSAGCSMADMAGYEDTVDAWQAIHAAIGAKKQRVIPITYVNSTAAIKAFVGQHGGACCTSSNAKRVFEWALHGGEIPVAKDETIKILFLPDQHLGRNTAKSHGFITEVDAAAKNGGIAETALWNPKLESGGLKPAQICNAKVLLWAGHCSVHKLFRPEHVAAARKERRTVIVHPECAQEVVDIADLSGSTEYIIDTIGTASCGKPRRKCVHSQRMPVSLHHDVSHRPSAHGMVPRSTCGGQGRQSRLGARRCEAVGETRARPHAASGARARIGRACDRLIGTGM